MPRTMRAVSRRDFLKLGGVGLAGAALLGSAGCGGSQSSGSVVRYFTGTAETTSQERANIEIQVDRFHEQYPKYTLEREAVPPDEVRTLIKTRLQSDEPPDAFSYDTGPGFGGVLADAGLLRSLEDAYKKNGWNIYDWAKQRATYNGTVYGVPDQVEEIIVYYNKDLVPEVPKTVDELRQIANELKGQGIIPFAFGNQEQWPAGHLFSIGVSNVLGREGLDNILYANGRWDIPEVEEAINLLFREFVESGYYPEGLSSLSSDGANALFYTGKAAMNPTGTWLVPEIVQTVQDFEVGFFPFPSIEGSGISPPAGLGAGLFVAKEASNTQGAIEFIDYLLQDSTARLIIEKLNVIPAQPVNPKGLDVPQNFNEVMFSGFEEVLAGTRSPAEQSAALQDAWAEAKKQGKIATQD